MEPLGRGGVGGSSGVGVARGLVLCCLLVRGSWGHQAPAPDWELSPDSLLSRVDQDSALHNDLQILKEKEGADFILLNFSFKVRPSFLEPPSPSSAYAASSTLESPEDAGLPSLIIACLSLRITFPLTRHLSGLCLQSSPEGEWPSQGRG